MDKSTMAMGQLYSSWSGIVVLGDDWEGPNEENSPWGTGLAIWFLRWYVIKGGKDGSLGFCMVF